MPYPNNIEKSVQSLDDVRLNKQAVECYQLLTSALKERNGEIVKNYHPVYLFYKNNPDFLAYYGLKCCIEWEYRFDKTRCNKWNSNKGKGREPKWTQRGEPEFYKNFLKDKK